MRIVSLVPAATEIVASLGMFRELVGVSHQCDFPVEVQALPRVSRNRFHKEGATSREIDDQVRSQAENQSSPYELDMDLIRQLAPDVILTQRLCDVCAVGWDSVREFAATLPRPPQVVNLEPSNLNEILEGIRIVGQLAGNEGLRAADELVRQFDRRIAAVRSIANPQVSHSVIAASAVDTKRPSCLLLEWIDPPYCSGHWGPELIEWAGGRALFGNSGGRSTRLSWPQICESAAEVVVLACCGFSQARTMLDCAELSRQGGWHELPAVRNGRVFVVDGNSYFNRPGPRIIDSLELLAQILHPDRFSGWEPAIQPVLQSRPSES